MCAHHRFVSVEQILLLCYISTAQAGGYCIFEKILVPKHDLSFDLVFYPMTVTDNNLHLVSQAFINHVVSSFLSPCFSIFLN